MRLGVLGRLLAPGYGTCQRCGTPWKFVEGKTVWFSRGRDLPTEAEVIGALQSQLQEIALAVRVEWQPVGQDVRGVFALCEKCWAEATLNEKVDAYLGVIRNWDGVTAKDYRALTRAVTQASGYAINTGESA